MSVKMTEQVEVLEVTREIEIAATIDVVWETLLENMGPLNEAPDKTPHNLTLEAWPGGRWYRDFGSNTGYWWGTVQAIRPPELLEMHGPMFMSAPAVNHVIFRLKKENGLTRIDFAHRAVGLIPHHLMDGVDVNNGWDNFFVNVRAGVDERAKR
ncbi:SRPBCC domain-containing protein [Alloacidobacterium dinghuense]|uniref:SRPBCC domain-containing protein n=1 Tax=Alloacidobacterium dinghuense TaxID=2763107 RepID=A0A7G8BKB1_9BACT|nr:SRPBCC domain-containing protein [Alloacidobacterium dinghuense]QNI32981.1 SRPBCC domain-containing protein [Alloacidobacterium dinghuense]